MDPIPDVCATAGKALGNLMGGMGETAELVEVVPWLALTPCSEESPVERLELQQGWQRCASV